MQNHPGTECVQTVSTVGDKRAQHTEQDAAQDAGDCCADRTKVVLPPEAGIPQAPISVFKCVTCNVFHVFVNLLYRVSNEVHCG